MDPETEPLEQFQQRLREHRPYLTRESVGAALNWLRLELAAATDARLHFQGSFGTPLEYDPAYQAVNDREHALFLACVTLDQELESLEKGDGS